MPSTNYKKCHQFSKFPVSQYLPAGDINDEADIVNCDPGNIQLILMTKEIYKHYLISPNQSNSNLFVLICIIG